MITIGEMLQYKLRPSPTKNSHGISVLRLTPKPTAKRVRMFARDPYCFWCGRVTILHTSEISDPRLATIDHLYSRLNPKRHQPRGNDRSELLHVLACRQCNHERSVAEQQGRIFSPKIPERLSVARESSAV